jgi:ATP-dependent DNA helicase RecG
MKELKGLVVGVLLNPLEPGRLYALADQLRGRYAKNGQTGEYCHLSKTDDTQLMGPSWDQVGTKLGLSSDQVQILQNLSSEQPLADLMVILGRTNRTKFRDQVLKPLIDAGLVEMAVPDRPRSSKQKYRLTQKGRSLMSQVK